MKKLPLALLCIAFLLLCVAHKAVGGEETKLPADAQKLLEKFQVDEAKILAESDEKVAKARRTMIETLTKQQEKATKGGKLDEALALKAKIEEQTKLMPGGTLLLSAPAPQEQHTSKFVMLYPLPNFQGQPVVIKTIGTILNTQALGFPNDGLRSIKVPAGFTVTTFDNEDGGGAATVLTADTAELTGTKASSMTSLLIAPVAR